MNGSTRKDAQFWVVLVSAVAVPMIVAGIGAWIQSTVAQQGSRTAFVTLAVEVLSVRETAEQDQRLRAWAVSVLDDYSPVPLGKDVQDDLVAGALYFRRDGWQPDGWQPGDWQPWCADPEPYRSDP